MLEAQKKWYRDTLMANHRENVLSFMPKRQKKHEEEPGASKPLVGILKNLPLQSLDEDEGQATVINKLSIDFEIFIKDSSVVNLKLSAFDVGEGKKK